MYARLLTFRLGPGTRETGEKLADEFYPLMKSLKGFRSVAFLMWDEEAGEFGSFSLWETKEDAEAAGDVLRARFQETAAAQSLQAPPSLRVMEVYEPTA
ncbi:MAG: antibiotic biosynthesis monooxygenase family protein [Alphaproteobacteria bacterium]